MKKLNIAVIEGGYSHEKIISLKSAKTVRENLDTSMYNAYQLRIDEDGWIVHIGDSIIEVNKNDFSIQSGDKNVQFDCAFIVIHGTPGEDGKLQAYFDMIGVPYTTCDQLMSTLTFNKFVCNQFLKNFGIPVAKGEIVRPGESYNSEKIISQLGLPCFVKPADGGSSYGVSKVTQVSELDEAIQKAHDHGTIALIESFLEGREITNGVYKSLSGTKVLPITEIVTTNEFFDFDAKYKGESQEITPADLEPSITNEVKSLTKEIYDLLNLTGIARIDYILHEGRPHMIEINTVPGQSAESIIPQMAEKEGITLSTLFHEVIQVAIG